MKNALLVLQADRCLGAHFIRAWNYMHSVVRSALKGFQKKSQTNANVKYNIILNITLSFLF